MQEDGGVEDYLGAGMKGPQRRYRVGGGRQAAWKNTTIKKVGHWRQGPSQSHTRSKDEGEREVMVMNILVTVISEKMFLLHFSAQFTLSFCAVLFTPPFLLCF